MSTARYLARTAPGIRKQAEADLKEHRKEEARVRSQSICSMNRRLTELRKTEEKQIADDKSKKEHYIKVAMKLTDTLLQYGPLMTEEEYEQQLAVWRELKSKIL